MAKKEFNIVVRERREFLRFTVREVADAIGVSKSIYQRWEGVTNKWRRSAMPALCVYLKLDVTSVEEIESRYKIEGWVREDEEQDDEEAGQDAGVAGSGVATTTKKVDKILDVNLPPNASDEQIESFIEAVRALLRMGGDGRVQWRRYENQDNT